MANVGPLRNVGAMRLGGVAMVLLFAAGCPEGGRRIERCHPDFGSVAGSDDVTLIGRGFQPGLTVKFGRKLARVVSVRQDAVEVKTPPSNEVGRVDVSVIGHDGSALVLRSGFRYVEAGQNPLEKEQPGAAPPPR